MKLFLKLKHWQLFLVLVGIPIVFQILIFYNIYSKNNISDFLLYFSLMLVFFIFILFSWFYTLGINLHKILPENIIMSITKFKILFIISILFYILFFVYLFMLDNYQPLLINYFMLIMILILVGSFATMYGTLYCLYFIAKALKSVELNKEVTFSDFAGEFFLLWFYPIGIWIIQPKINKLFDENIGNAHNENL